MRVVRCVCHAVPVEGFGCRGVHECTLIDCCMSECWKIVACSFWRSLRGSCSDSYYSILLGKWPSAVLHNNIPLQSTLTPCVV